MDITGKLGSRVKGEEMLAAASPEAGCGCKQMEREEGKKAQPKLTLTLNFSNKENFSLLLNKGRMSSSQTENGRWLERSLTSEGSGSHSTFKKLRNHKYTCILKLQCSSGVTGYCELFFWVHVPQHSASTIESSNTYVSSLIMRNCISPAWKKQMHGQVFLHLFETGCT